MKHYGIWYTVLRAWMTDDSGMLFWTISKAVAQAQLKTAKGICEVKEYIDETEEQP